MTSTEPSHGLSPKLVAALAPRRVCGAGVANSDGCSFDRGVPTPGSLTKGFDKLADVGLLALADLWFPHKIPAGRRLSSPAPLPAPGGQPDPSPGPRDRASSSRGGCAVSMGARTYSNPSTVLLPSRGVAPSPTRRGRCRLARVAGIPAGPPAAEVTFMAERLYTIPIRPGPARASPPPRVAVAEPAPRAVAIEGDDVGPGLRC